VLAYSEPLHLVLIANPTVRARLALRRATCVGSPEEALLRTTDAAFESSGQAIVECQGASPPVTPEEGQSLGTVRVVSYEADRVELEATATAASVLVLADAYYRGWSATVDGRAAAILPTNVAGRGLLLEPGRHPVVFTYRTPDLLSAAALSLATLLLGAGFGLVGSFRRVRARRGGPG